MKTLQQINEKFDREFENNAHLDVFYISMINGKERGEAASVEEIKTFISSSLRDILEGIIPRIHMKDLTDTASTLDRADGWNDCREQIISNINKILNEKI